MPILHVTVRERGGPETTAEEIVAALNVGITAAIQWWHREIFPGHFRLGAAAKYIYKKRGKQHMIRKARRYHHQLPLVWTGAMRNEMTRYLRVDTLKRRAEGKGKMHGPGYKNLYWRELTETTPGEAARMAKIVDRVSTQKLNGNQKATSRKIA